MVQRIEPVSAHSYGWPMGIKDHPIGQPLRESVWLGFRDGAYFDNAHGCRRKLSREFNGLIQVLAVQDIDAAELLLGFHVRAIPDRQFTILSPHGRRGAAGLQPGVGLLDAALFRLPN